jgi:biotin operon repressor
MPYVSAEAIRLFEQGSSAQDIYKKRITTLLGDPISKRQARAWHQYWREGIADTGSTEVGSVETNSMEVEAIIKLAKNRPISLKILSESLDRSENSIRAILAEMQAAGYNISVERAEAHLSTRKWIAPVEQVEAPIARSTRVKLAVVSDTHTGSKAEQHTHLMHFLNYALDKGYRDFAWPGDLTEGLGMRTGHELGMYVHTVDDIISLLHRPFRLLSQYGARSYVIGGNHDFSIPRNCKIDPISTVCAAYDDVYFLGYDKADVPITDKVSFRMWHPDGAGANPVGKLQKSFQVLAHEEMMAQLGSQDAESSNVLITFVGHLHINSMLQHGRRVAMQVSCFQGITDFLERHALIPSVGGHLFEFEITDGGELISWTVENKLYTPIKDDYLNHDIPSMRAIDTAPIMVRILGVPQGEKVNVAG